MKVSLVRTLGNLCVYAIEKPDKYQEWRKVLILYNTDIAAQLCGIKLKDFKRRNDLFLIKFRGEEFIPNWYVEFIKANKGPEYTITCNQVRCPKKKLVILCCTAEETIDVQVELGTGTFACIKKTRKELEQETPTELELNGDCYY